MRLNDYHVFYAVFGLFIKCQYKYAIRLVLLLDWDLCLGNEFISDSSQCGIA